MEAALILAALLPTFSVLSLAIGGTLVYLVMTQQKILALARVPRREAAHYNVEDKDAGVIIKRYEHAGYSIDRDSFKRNRFSGNFDFIMELAV